MAKSFVGVTKVLAHSFPTTFTFKFLKMLMKQIKEEHTALEVLHFISDCPSSQYRNWFTCDMVAHFRIIVGVVASWSWLEKGHGNLIKTAKMSDST